MTQKPKSKAAQDQASAPIGAQVRGPSKLERLEALLRREGGATLAEMTADTGWQAHSVRGALAGALKKRGHAVTSEKVEGARRYRLAAA